MYIYISRIVDNSKPVKMEILNGLLYYSERYAHVFIIKNKNGELTGSVSGRFVVPEEDVEIELNGSIVNGVAIVTLYPACYVYSGSFELYIYNDEGAGHTVIYSCKGYIRDVSGGTPIDPGTVVPDVAAIVAKYGLMQSAIQDTQAATNSATAAAASANTAASNANSAAAAAATAGESKFVRFEAAQTLTDAQKTQARDNIGAADSNDLDTVGDDKFVRFDATQTLSDAQKAAARRNMGLNFADSGDGEIVIS